MSVIRVTNPIPITNPIRISYLVRGAVIPTPEPKEQPPEPIETSLEPIAEPVIDKPAKAGKRGSRAKRGK